MDPLNVKREWNVFLLVFVVVVGPRFGLYWYVSVLVCMAVVFVLNVVRVLCVCVPLLVFDGVCAVGGVCVVSNTLLLLLLLLFICQIRACSSAGVSSVIRLFSPLSLSVMTCFVLGRWYLKPWV